ncbi:hypothetical protein Cs7R123_63230 [Catellatospora sp. TT07R-123]|nr:hypothetical protein Cs7R123_63230 [Catellatospora sp. TT07R-123]
MIRSATAMIVGSLLLAGMIVAPPGVYHLTGSLVAGLVCLVVALMAGAVVFTLMSQNKLTYGPAGLYVMSEDGSHTLAWDDIDRFDFGRWVSGDKRRPDLVRGMVIHLKSGGQVLVDWINTKRTIRQLNDALARYSGRPAPDLTPEPARPGSKLTFVGVLTAFNIVVLWLMGRVPVLFLVAIVVDVLAVCVYMGVSMSRRD